MSLLRRHAVLLPKEARALSLFENVKKILGRATPPSPLPSEPTLQSSGELPNQTVDASNSTEITKSGGQRKSKLVGFKVETPKRLTGSEFQSELESAYKDILGTKSTIPDRKKLRLAQKIWERTGTRVPDFVLNSAKHTVDLTAHFVKEERKGTGRVNVLHLDRVEMPSNVKVM